MQPGGPQGVSVGALTIRYAIWVPRTNTMGPPLWEWAALSEACSVPMEAALWSQAFNEKRSWGMGWV